jgi:hypothetical protein
MLGRRNIVVVVVVVVLVQLGQKKPLENLGLYERIVV